MCVFVYPVIDMEATGQKLRMLRKQKGLTIKNVSEALSISPQALGKWESGKTLPTLDNFFALSLLYGTKINIEIVGIKMYKKQTTGIATCGLFFYICIRLRGFATACRLNGIYLDMSDVRQ